MSPIDMLLYPLANATNLSRPETASVETIGTETTIEDDTEVDHLETGRAGVIERIIDMRSGRIGEGGATKATGEVSIL